VEIFCTELTRLLPAEKVAALRERWGRETPGTGGDAGEFCQWLVAKHVVTEYQAGFVSRGHADQLFVGHYTIIERIGKGRMAGVYKAVDTQGHTVAIKILPRSKATNNEIVARFQREARLALQLQHPNLVRTIETGEERGLHFIVMEYLEGELLEEMLQLRKRLSPREAVRIAYQALRGLEHLHENAMVHRDLKPGNIMLLPPDVRRKGKAAIQQPRVKILDIGLGLGLFEEEDVEGNEYKLTTEGTMLGTPDYLAPEQARDAHAVTIRADIYSLGCVLYHALTGQPPFPDTSAIRQLVRHATETPLPLRTLNPAIPEALQPILDRMLAKNPDDRYAAPQEAANALRGFLAAKESRRKATTAARIGPDSKRPQAAGQPRSDAASSAAARNPAARTGPAQPSSIPAITPKVAVPVVVAAASPVPTNLGPATPVSADVELVTNLVAEEPQTGLTAEWGRREWLIFAFGMAAGGGVVLALGGLGFLGSKLLRRRSRDTDAAAPADSDGPGAP
jgi:serine/threonine protein kinase